MKKIDLYIIKKFLGTYFYSIALIISITIVFDLTEKLEDFIEYKAPVNEIIFDYYLNFVPYFANMFSALFTFISVIFFTSRMAVRSEFIAMLSNGVSFNRILFPYFIASTILAILSFVLMSYIIPPANKTRLEFINKYISPYTNLDRNIHRQIDPGIFIYMESYNNSYNIGYRFSMEKFEDKKLKIKLNSDFIQWDSIKNLWTINNYIIREFDGTDEKLKLGNQLDTIINMKPADFGTRQTIVETMTLPRLIKFIEEQHMHGNENLKLFLLEKHRRFAFPFATFILTLIGVSLSIRKTRGGTGIHISLGLLLSFLYILFMQVSTTFTINSNAPAWFSMWLPNFVFAFIAAYLYRIAPR